MPVYVIQAGDGGPCKIGRAKNVRQRLSELQVGTHMRLRLVALYEGGVLEERELHRQFRAFRLDGEWFWLRLPQALLEIKLTAIAEPKPATKPLPQWVPEPDDEDKFEKLRKPGGSLVCALMRAKGLKPEDLAGVVGGSIETVMEFGVRVHPRRFERLAAALGVDHQFLYYGRNFVRRPMGRPA